MATPLTGIPTPTYSPTAWADLADALAALEELAIVPFDTEGDRDDTIPFPNEGQACYIRGAGGGVCIYTPTGWKYLEWRP